MDFKPLVIFKNLSLGSQRLIIVGSLLATFIIGGNKTDYETSEWFFHSLLIVLPIIVVCVCAILWIYDGFKTEQKPLNPIVVQEVHKPNTKDEFSNKNQERTERLKDLLLNASQHIEKKDFINSTDKIKIAVSFKEKDILNYNNTDIREGLLNTFSRTAKFSLSDLKRWKDKIHFSELHANPNINIDSVVLKIFEHAHDDSYSDNKRKWDKSFYEEKVKNMTYEDFASLIEIISTQNNKTDEVIFDDDLPF